MEEKKDTTELNNNDQASGAGDEAPAANPVRSAFLVLAGGYLIYLAFGLRTAAAGTQGFEKVTIIAAIIVFVLVGGFLIVKNIKAVLNRS